MTKNESTIWIWNIFNSCYVVKNPDNTDVLFFFHDSSYIPSRKLSILNSINNTTNTNECGDGLPHFGDSECMLIIHTTLFSINCSNDKIYQYLKLNYTSNINTLDKFIKGEIHKFNFFKNTFESFFIDHSYLCHSNFSLNLNAHPVFYAIDTSILKIVNLDIKSLL